jgi:hypothetical protein
MRATITDPKQPVWRRLAWFAGLWLAGVATVGAVAWLLRLAIRGLS